MGVSGYHMVYMPDHPDANTRGFVAEHRAVAEELIGRKLRKGEEVHHIDCNRLNNDPSNLIVFVSKADHQRYHQGAQLIETDEPFVFRSGYVYPPIPCAYCGEIFHPKTRTGKYCCTECCNLAMRKIPRPSKRELKKLIIEFNLNQIGEIYGVSSNGVRRWLQYESLPWKLKDIKKLREKERRKQEQKAMKEELKERVIERDREIDSNTE